MSLKLNQRQGPTHAGMLIAADRGHLERLAGSLRRGLALSAVLLAGCGSIAYPLGHYEAVYTKASLETPAPDPVALSHLDAARVNHGRYLVEIAGCGTCHTDGALIGESSAVRLLAGSHLGIAYTNPFRDSFPGVAYPSNLTPDPRTGLGNWSDAQIAAAIRSGDLASDPGHLMVMPWPLYQHMSDEDVNAIVDVSAKHSGDRASSAQASSARHQSNDAVRIFWRISVRSRTGDSLMLEQLLRCESKCPGIGAGIRLSQTTT